MFDPPPGFDDILGDADDAPSCRRWRPLEVPGVGELLARKPRPNGIAWLAMAANPDVEGGVQRDHLMQFVSHHVDGAALEWLQDRMIDTEGGMPIDAMERVARELATWGTARPYVAVINLAFHTAHHWRAIRHKLVTGGVADPMRLPSMHPILDVTEMAVLEWMTDSTDLDASERKRTDFIDKLYAPPVTRKLNGDKYKPVVAPPPGFEPKQVTADFNAFMRQQGGVTRPKPDRGAAR